VLSGAHRKDTARLEGINCLNTEYLYFIRLLPVNTAGSASRRGGFRRTNLPESHPCGVGQGLSYSASLAYHKQERASLQRCTHGPKNIHRHRLTTAPDSGTTSTFSWPSYAILFLTRSPPLFLFLSSFSFVPLFSMFS
jgi:hypothetical protein